MNISFISDTHNKHNHLQLFEGDILIHSGDFTGVGNKSEVENFLKWFNKQPFKYKIFIAGNHELTFENKPEWLKEMLYNLPNNTFYLEDSWVNIEGIKFYGSPWQPKFYNWGFNLPRGEKLMEKWNLIPHDTNVLITHGPPFGKLDISGYGNVRTGCESLIYRVEEIKPKIHCFGHIHGSYGMTQNENTIFINASTCDEGYRPVNKPIILNYKEI